MIFSEDFSQAPNTFFEEKKLDNSLTYTVRDPSHGAADPTPGCRQRSLPERRIPATRRVQTTTPRGREHVMKHATNTRTRLRASRHGALALLLAATLGTGAHAAHAATAPSTAELELCLHRAGLGLDLRDHDLRALRAQKFSLGRERHVIALDTEIATGRAALSPRLYCTVERGGEISLVSSMPRLPQRPAAALVAN